MDSAAEARFGSWAQGRVGQLHRTAYLLCGDWHVAEDLVQDALARTALHWKRVESSPSPDAYVRQVLVNESRRRWRRRSSHERPSADVGALVADDGSYDRAARDELMQALHRLPRRQRAAVVLRYFEQLSETETAQAMGCSVGTVKSTTHRALAALRGILTTEVHPPC